MYIIHLWHIPFVPQYLYINPPLYIYHSIKFTYEQMTGDLGKILPPLYLFSHFFHPSLHPPFSNIHLLSHFHLIFCLSINRQVQSLLWNPPIYTFRLPIQRQARSLLWKPTYLYFSLLDKSKSSLKNRKLYKTIVPKICRWRNIAQRRWIDWKKYSVGTHKPSLWSIY